MLLLFMIDDAVARIMKSEGGLLWACKNYDGDVMSDMLASSYGSLAMMTSVLVSPLGCYMYEEALRKRGELDQTPDVVTFDTALEQSAMETIENGVMTGDLIRIATPDERNQQVYTEDFLQAIKTRLESKLG